MKRRSLVLALSLVLLFISFPGSPTSVSVAHAGGSCTVVATSGVSATSIDIPIAVNSGDEIIAKSGTGNAGATLTANIAEPGGTSKFALATGGSSGTTSVKVILKATVGGIAIVTFAGDAGYSYTVTVCPAGVPTVQLAFTDGRCNQEADQTAAVYPDNKGGYTFYAIYQGVGSFAFSITKQELANNPAKDTNYLIKSVMGVSLYRYTNGDLVVMRLKADGTTYWHIIGSCGAVS